MSLSSHFTYLWGISCCIRYCTTRRSTAAPSKLVEEPWGCLFLLTLVLSRLRLAGFTAQCAYFTSPWRIVHCNGLPLPLRTSLPIYPPPRPLCLPIKQAHAHTHLLEPPLFLRSRTSLWLRHLRCLAWEAALCDVGASLRFEDMVVIVRAQAALRVSAAAAATPSLLHVPPNPFLRGAAPVYIRPEDFPKSIARAEKEEYRGAVHEGNTSIPGWSPEMDSGRKEKSGHRKGGKDVSRGASVHGNGGGTTKGGSISAAGASAGRGQDVRTDVSVGRVRGQSRVPRVQHDSLFDMPLDALTVA